MDIAPHIKELQPGDWELFKTLRLRALRLHPDVFCPSTDEFQRSDLEWEQFLENQNFKAFALILESRPIGLTGVFQDRDDPSGETGVCVMSFIEDEHRSQGYSKLLYEARIAWAKKHPKIKKLSVSHREGNEASKRASQKMGFRFKDAIDWTWNCGSNDKLYRYELLLD